MANSHSETITIVTAVFFSISVVTVMLRCFVRLRLIRAFGWDDAFMVVALLCNIGFATSSLLGAKYGMGKKLEYFILHAEYFTKALFCFWLGQLFYIALSIVVKVSIVLMLLRITVNRIHIGILFTAMALVIVAGTIFFFFTLFQCKPVEHFWHRLDQPGKCQDLNVIMDIAYMCSAVAALTDFIVGLLPALIIQNLQMTRRNKILAGGIMSLGSIAGAAVIARFPYLKNYGSQEFLYKTSNIAILSNLEGSLCIIAGSLPTLRPLFRFCRELSQNSRSYIQKAGSSSGSTTLRNSTLVTPSKLAQDDAQHLWAGPRDVEAYRMHTVVLGNGRVVAASMPTNSSEEDMNPHPSTVMGSQDLGRMRKM